MKKLKLGTKISGKSALKSYSKDTKITITVHAFFKTFLGENAPRPPKTFFVPYFALKYLAIEGIASKKTVPVLKILPPLLRKFLDMPLDRQLTARTFSSNKEGIWFGLLLRCDESI